MTGHPFVRHWLHVGLVGLDGTKMSKSLGNLVFVDDLLDRAESGAVRLALLDHHYRSDWDWVDGDLDLAVARLERWRSSQQRDPGDAVLALVRSRLDDDLDTPGALRAIDEHALRGDDVRPAAALLGVSL